MRSVRSTLAGMKPTHTIPIQFHTNDGIGLSFVNAAAHKRLGGAVDRKSRPPSRPNLTGAVPDDMIALGTSALIAHVGQLLAREPVKVLRAVNNVTRIRVCDALDYVIDHAQRQVWAEQAPLTAFERKTPVQPPWQHPMAGAVHNVDMLNPLCKPAWLGHIAARPGWFGYAFARHAEGQQQLFAGPFDCGDALNRIVAAAWQHHCNSAAAIALRHQLAVALVLHIGPSTIDLALRARLRNKPEVLSATHLSLVWRHRAAFARVADENPLLLTALTAWLTRASTRACVPDPLIDAVPAMRRDVMAAGLPPKAWRYLAQHGAKLLIGENIGNAAWSALLTGLKALNVARWPPLPPRKFLRLLHDTAGRPKHYEATNDYSAGGWFWEVTCEAAAECKADTAAYKCLLDQIPNWAWMMCHYHLRPDKHQRRKGIAWLRSMSDAMQSLAAKQDAPEWALWLPAEGWADIHRLNALPLQSPGALVREAIALHNCADAFTEECRSESHVMISLRNWGTDKPVALVMLERYGSNWVVNQVAGPCNRDVNISVRQLAGQVCDWVRYHHNQRPAHEQVPLPDNSLQALEEPLDVHLMFQ